MILKRTHQFFLIGSFLFVTTHAMEKYPTRWQKTTNYALNAAQQAVLDGMVGGPQAIVPSFVEHTSKEVVQQGIAKTLHLQKPTHYKMMNYGVDFLSSGIKHRLFLPKSTNWFSNFIKSYGLQLSAALAVDLFHTGLVRSTGIDYPSIIKKNSFIYMLAATMVPFWVKNIWHTGYAMLFNRMMQPN